MAEIQFNNGKKPKRWVAPIPIPADIEVKLTVYPPAFRQVLFNRGLDTAEKAFAFLQGALIEHDPFLMKGMHEAVDMVLAVIESGGSIIVYGDYDVDGVTSTALLTQAIRLLGGRASEYIPNRFDEGYGLNTDALKELKARNAALVVTVDCGIRSTKEAEYARELGVKLIITDHHHPLDTVPPADVVICPKQAGDEYPYKELTGVGIAYKMARALFGKSGGNPAAAEQWLDLVALGTVSDIAPLTDENRLLVKQGLRLMQTEPRQGIYSLMVVSDIIRLDQSGALSPNKPIRLTAGDIGFKLGPRLNAAGRMESAMEALDLLLCTDNEQAGLLAQKLQVKNADRQEKTIQNQKFAEKQLPEIDNLPILISFGSESEFHSGIVGLVAARLVESHYRPAVVGVIGEDFTRASCRSIDEFHITAALDQCADILVRHGGHSKAAGFTVKNENREELKNRLLEIASSQLKPEDLVPSIAYDAEVQVEDLQAPLIALLEQMEPTGNENSKPVFLARSLRVTRKMRIGHDKTHLRMTVKNENNRFVDAVGFRLGDWVDAMPEVIDILFYFETNEYNGQKVFQLNVRDIRPSEESQGDDVNNSPNEA